MDFTKFNNLVKFHGQYTLTIEGYVATDKFGSSYRMNECLSTWQYVDNNKRHAWFGEKYYYYSIIKKRMVYVNGNLRI